MFTLPSIVKCQPYLYLLRAGSAQPIEHPPFCGEYSFTEEKNSFFLNLHFRRNFQFCSVCASFGNKISLLLRFLLENKYVVVCSGPQHHPAQEGGGLSPPQAHTGVHHLVRNSFTSFVLLFFLDTYIILGF